MRHWELWERRGRSSLSPSPAALGQGRVRRRRCLVPVEALLDGLSLVGHGEALAGEAQGDVFSLRCTGRGGERGSEDPPWLGTDCLVPAF